MLGIFASQRNLSEAVDENGNVTGTVRVQLSELTGNLENVLDMLSERLIGSAVGQDISYRAVGIEDDGTTLLLEVTLDPSVAQEDGE